MRWLFVLLLIAACAQPEVQGPDLSTPETTAVLYARTVSAESINWTMFERILASDNRSMLFLERVKEDAAFREQLEAEFAAERQDYFQDGQFKLTTVATTCPDVGRCRVEYNPGTSSTAKRVGGENPTRSVELVLEEKEWRVLP